MVITIYRKPRNGHARNWPGVVFIDPNLRYKRAIWAQEYYEARFKLNPINFIKTRLNKKARRKMEFVSHEIEVQAAVKFYGVDEKVYRAAEAKSMIGGYDGIFKEREDVIYYMLEDKKEFAKDFVNRNEIRIRLVKE